jgi:PPOX class probable F420-dependent enzyme
MTWTRAQVDAFLDDGSRIGRLATVSADGAPHVAPIWYRRKDDRLLVHTLAGSTKGGNVAATGRYALTVDKDTPPYAGVIVMGAATIATDVSWESLIRELSNAYMGPDAGPGYGDYIVSMPGEHVVLALAIDDWEAWDYSPS